MIEERARIVFNREIANRTYYMGLRSPRIVAAAKPGQFVMLRVTDGLEPLLRRPFSICRVEGDRVFCLLYRVVGRGTAIMSRTGEGKNLSVLGPLGKGFELLPAGGRSLLVAGGIGIAPLIFLAPAIEKNKMVFLAGYRSADDIIPMEEVGLEYGIAIATDDGTAGHRGPVTELLENYVKGAGAGCPTVFACGPLPMLKEVAALTTRWHIPCQVSMETWMACGLGACQGCSVKGASLKERPYRHVCQDGPVFDVNAIDWNGI